MKSRSWYFVIAVIAGLGLCSLAQASPVNGVGTAVKNAIAKPFRVIAKRKQGRVFHQRGDLYQASLTLDNSGVLGNAKTSQPVLVRVSRGSGRAADKSDILGFAIRTGNPEVHDDILLVSARGRGKVARRLPRMAQRFDGLFSSITPFKTENGKVIALVEGAPHVGIPSLTDLQVLRDQVSAGNADFKFALQPVGRAARRPAQTGTLHVESILPAFQSEKLSMQPWDNQLVAPTGVINWIRRHAYRGSQAGRAQP